MSRARWLLAAGPVSLAVLFFIRAISPAPDATLLAIFVVLAIAVVASLVGSRWGDGVVLILSLLLFQPVTAREFSFNLSSADSQWWRAWAVGSVIALGCSLIGSLMLVVGEPGPGRAALGVVGGIGLGLALIPLFAELAPQPGFGRDLDRSEIEALPVIEMLNFRFEPAIVSVDSNGVYRAKVVNPSDLPHTITLDALDLEVFVPAGRWSIIEIEGADLVAGQLEIYCSIGDHRAEGMLALLEVE